METLPPLNALQVFEAAARHLSFARAAKELHVTPSAVSHQVKLLEAYLERKLFHRLDKRVEFTQEGRSYFSQIQPALKKIQAATAELKGKIESEILTISAAPVMATRWLMLKIYRFQEANPQLEIRIHASTEIVNFNKSDIDLGIRHGTGNWPRLIALEVFREVLTPVCSKRIIRNSNLLKTPVDLLNFPLLQCTTRPDEWSDWLGGFGLKKPDLCKEASFQSTAQALEAAMLGLGIVLMDKRLIKQELKQGALITPLQEEQTDSSAFFLVYPETESSSVKINLFKDWIKTEIEAETAGH